MVGTRDITEPQLPNNETWDAKVQGTDDVHDNNEIAIIDVMSGIK